MPKAFTGTFPFGAVDFEWHAEKRLRNFAKHQIDFCDVPAALEAGFVVVESAVEGEPRWLAICRLDGRIVSVVFTMRGSNCRIISARGARSDEKGAYYAYFRG